MWGGEIQPDPTLARRRGRVAPLQLSPEAGAPAGKPLLPSSRATLQPGRPELSRRCPARSVGGGSPPGVLQLRRGHHGCPEESGAPGLDRRSSPPAAFLLRPGAGDREGRSPHREWGGRGHAGGETAPDAHPTGCPPRDLGCLQPKASEVIPEMGWGDAALGETHEFGSVGLCAPPPSPEIRPVFFPSAGDDGTRQFRGQFVDPT